MVVTPYLSQAAGANGCVSDATYVEEQVFLFSVNVHWRNEAFIIFCTNKLSLKP